MIFNKSTTIFTAFTFFFVAAGLLFTPAAGHAQDAEDRPVTVDEFIQPVQDKYQPITMKSLSKLYWAIGKFELTNNEAINNYMIINECELYSQYYHDDLEWANLREATRQYLSDNLSRFPTHFEYIVPISLDRYDVEEEVFKLDPESAVINAKRLDIRTVRYQTKSSQTRDNECLGRHQVPGYQEHLILALNQPFTITEIEVPPELADLYLQEAKAMYEELPASLKLSRYERIAYLRMKLRITTYKEDIRDASGGTRPLLLGAMDGYEVYADYEKMKPLATQDMKTKRRVRRRKPPEQRHVQPVEERKQTVDFSSDN